MTKVSATALEPNADIIEFTAGRAMERARRKEEGGEKETGEEEKQVQRK